MQMASRARPKRARVSQFALAEQYCHSACDQEGFTKRYIDANIGEINQLYMYFNYSY